MSIRRDVRNLIEETPFVDTHEHLWDETTRLGERPYPGGQPGPARDFSLLATHYIDSDLISAGMTQDGLSRLRAHDTDLEEKWRIFAPIYARCRNTGYLRNLRETVRMLYGEDDLREDNYGVISERIAALIQPGYMRRVLKDVARVEHAQVNSFEDVIFNETAQPDLLCQDLSFVALSTGMNATSMAELSQRSGVAVRALADWHQVIDWAFAAYGPRAIAVKNQSAYGRRLDYEDVPAEEVASLFERFAGHPDSVPSAERKHLQDHLFHYCVRKAVEYDLPVKLHTGYFAGNNGMPLERVRNNAGDLCPILKAHPQARFVIMHNDYPYQDEAIALAKHYSNAYVDMCWAWIINPAAGVRFVKEFLGAAPASKLLTFGGDYGPVEMVPGHAAIARQGLAQGLTELAEEGWIREDELPALIERLMRGNAKELFDYEGTLRAWG